MDMEKIITMILSVILLISCNSDSGLENGKLKHNYTIKVEIRDDNGIISIIEYKTTTFREWNSGVRFETVDGDYYFTSNNVMICPVGAYYSEPLN